MKILNIHLDCALLREATERPDPSETLLPSESDILLNYNELMQLNAAFYILFLKIFK